MKGSAAHNRALRLKFCGFKSLHSAAGQVASQGAAAASAAGHQSSTTSASICACLGGGKGGTFPSLAAFVTIASSSLHSPGTLQWQRCWTCVGGGRGRRGHRGRGC